MFPWKQKPGVSGGLTETSFHISTVRQSRGCPPKQSFLSQGHQPRLHDCRSASCKKKLQISPDVDYGCRDRAALFLRFLCALSAKSVNLNPSYISFI